MCQTERRKMLKHYFLIRMSSSLWSIISARRHCERQHIPLSAPLSLRDTHTKSKGSEMANGIHWTSLNYPRTRAAVFTPATSGSNAHTPRPDVGEPIQAPCLHYWYNCRGPTLLPLTRYTVKVSRLCTRSSHIHDLIHSSHECLVVVFPSPYSYYLIFIADNTIYTGK
jgi:hypothetical protein